MDVDGDVDMLDDTTQQTESVCVKQCFSPIQRRKLASVPMVCQLCPSMDLLVVAMNDTLWIHRTVSWQRLATWKLPQETSENNDDDDNNDDNQDVHVVCSAVCWSPDGRSLAIALSNGTVALHHVEALSADDDSDALHTIALHHHVVSLTWAHVGRPHASWTLSEDELERQATWHYQSRYLDRASTFLPPSSHHHAASSEEHTHTTATTTSGGVEAIGLAQATRPSCHTPLSLLCAITQDDKIHLYLHGRFAIATLDCAHLPIRMVCTSDLTNLLVWSNMNDDDNNTPGSSRGCLTICHLPALARYRYPLQVISSLYCSMICHLATIERGIQEVAASWKSSLRPLDTKLQALQRLLENYNVPSSRDVRSVLHQYLVVGSTNDDPITNALEAFFSNVQMNDQLVQRLERSLHSAVANVESLTRRTLLAPAISLVYDAGELQSEPSSLIGSNASVMLQRACHVLVLTVQDLVANMVEARFRLRDVVSWLRSAGSQIKARGTAVHSGQRENAKRRRVPHATLERMATYLQGDCVTGGGDSLTESLIGISIAEFFSNEQNYMRVRRSSSPTTFDVLATQASESKRPTVAFAFQRTRATMNAAFEQPKSFVSQSITQQDFVLAPQASDESHSVCAIHARLGGNLNSNLRADSEEGIPNFFSPKVAPGDNVPVGCCRSWSIVAKVANFHGGNENSVHVFALPLGWRDGMALDEVMDNDDDDDDDDHCQVPVYLSCRLVLPSPYQVKEIAFYGDDGNSSLSAAIDSDGGTGKEGRQAMGLLVAGPAADNNSDLIANELWLLKYDQAVYHRVFLPSGDGNEPSGSLNEQSLIPESVIAVQPVQENQSEDIISDGRIIYAKTRRVSLDESGSSCRIHLSGSRGIGGVLVTAPNHVELDVYDLEEDPDDDATEDEE